MAVFLSNCEQLAQEFNCTVLVIHHTGKDASRGARGSVVVKTNVDVMIRVNGGQGTQDLTLEKMREEDTGKPLRFITRKVELGEEDENGNPLTSLVLEPMVGVTVEGFEGSTKPLAGSQLPALQALYDFKRAHGWVEKGVELGEWCKAMDKAEGAEGKYPKPTVRKAAKRLIELGLVNQNGGSSYRINEGKDLEAWGVKIHQ
jgi:hypothetical protein